jgi:hypothetical protein
VRGCIFFKDHNAGRLGGFRRLLHGLSVVPIETDGCSFPRYLAENARFITSFAINFGSLTLKK